MQAWDILAYTYDADIYCPDCASARFGDALDDDRSPPEDSDGNPAHPVFADSGWDHPQCCSGCREFIPVILTSVGDEYVNAAIYNNYLDGADNTPLLRSWYDEYFDAEGFAEWMANRHPQVLAQLWVDGTPVDDFKPEVK